jgi:hypothetical protein
MPDERKESATTLHCIQTALRKPVCAQPCPTSRHRRDALPADCIAIIGIDRTAA